MDQASICRDIRLNTFINRLSKDHLGLVHCPGLAQCIDNHVLSHVTRCNPLLHHLMEQITCFSHLALLKGAIHNNAIIRSSWSARWLLLASQKFFSGTE
uniref:Uncharacterized protein n=1 Tax=Arundo donax TaxID=35708 RepID=A0A0A8ZYY7_ARUDO